MAYIWENYSSGKRYYVANHFSPYTEVLTSDKSNEAVNPNIRFSSIFYNLPELANLLNEYNHDLENYIFHLLAQVDLLKGLDKEQLLMNFFEREILDGVFGDFLANEWRKIKVRHKTIILNCMVSKYCRGIEEKLFSSCILKIFDSISITEEIKTGITYIYISEKKSEYNEAILNVIKLLFWKINKKIKICWGHHYGVIGANPTMKIGGIVII